MRITEIIVVGDPAIGFQRGERERPDEIWSGAAIDGIDMPDVKITVRYWLTGGHPLVVYIDGSSPLYPAVVYHDPLTSDRKRELIAVSPGKIGLYVEK